MNVHRHACQGMLLSMAAACAAASAIAAEPNWQTLFDGQTLDDWQPVGEATWTVADETIHTTGARPGFLTREAPLGDFELHVEFRAAATTNSGVFFSAVRELVNAGLAWVQDPENDKVYSGPNQPIPPDVPDERLAIMLR